MINTISPSSKSGASKWMKPQSSSDYEQDINNQKTPLHSFFKGGPQKIMGSTSGPIKALSIQNPNLPFGDEFQQKENNQSNGSLNKSKRFELNIIPKRMALSFSPPPTIIMEYLVPKTGKLYHHKIKIRGLSWESDTEKVLEQVKRRHEMYLTKISDVKLLKLISILQERIGVEEGKISGVIKPQAQQNNNNSQKETAKKDSLYNQELPSDEEDYNYDDFEDYAAYADQEHSKRQDDNEEEESNDINDNKLEEGNEENEEEEEQREGDFEYDSKAVFQSNGKNDADADDQEVEERNDEEEENEEEEDAEDNEEDENEEGGSDNEEEEEEEEEQNEQNEDSQEEGELNNQKCTGNKINEIIKHNEPLEDTKVEVKRNNFLDVKKEFDFFEDDEFGESIEESKPQKQESSESEDEEDIYQQVKKQLDSQKGIKPSTVSSYKGNIQSQKYSIQHYIKEQNNNEGEDEDEDDKEEEVEESETQEKSNNNQESSQNNDENKSQEEELMDEVDYDNYDLNKLKREEVERHKKMMDKQFEANRKKPGQIGFMYDMRMDFDPEESNDWDKSQNRMHTNEDNQVVDYDFV